MKMKKKTENQSNLRLRIEEKSDFIQPLKGVAVAKVCARLGLAHPDEERE